MSIGGNGVGRFGFGDLLVLERAEQLCVLLGLIDVVVVDEYPKSIPGGGVGDRASFPQRFIDFPAVFPEIVAVVVEGVKDVGGDGFVRSAH